VVKLQMLLLEVLERHGPVAEISDRVATVVLISRNGRRTVPADLAREVIAQKDLPA